ncbi:MAG: Alpha-1,4-glucan:maltose-1-phosphate maltosyltransferase 2 [Lentisphaerae bacterium ADurb.Bin242]|nr:MAG: Alpha-1,4-glucan:maltose-1-phosphate maltosyltransferase 2 [Lentisphaerae bacterium ADurb.Bin242]
MAEFMFTPSPGAHILVYCGDLIEFRLESGAAIRGRAWLRTNLGNAGFRRREIVEKVELGINPGLQDWHNLPMTRVDEFTFSLKLMITEEGHFEAKCYIAETEEAADPFWINGDNVHINVEPATYCCSNGVYCAFVRQFGVNKDKPVSSLPETVTAKCVSSLDQNRYAVIPPSGTFRDLIRELDHIFDTLKCRILHLLPVNPTPSVYGRMGRFGSPYAALDFTAVNPELAEFDRKATPLDQFQELADAVHRKNGKIFIDIAINHTGWAAKLHETHPEWFLRDPDGSIHSPGAWGVTWGDLTELDHSKPELWEYLAGVFRVWCRRGVDGFRCDAGYMIPEAAWEYIIAKIREEFPEIIFLLEGLGGDPSLTTRLLNYCNMNWAYSELFQNYSRVQIEGYLGFAWLKSLGDGVMIHYAETHDNLRLAAVSREYSKLRTALAALASTNGAFGFTNGVEWFATEKIDVHEASALNWGARENQVERIGRLNTILSALTSFHNGAVTTFIDSHSENCILLGRTDPGGGDPVLVAANLDTERSASVSWNVYSAPFDASTVYDLITGKLFELARSPGGRRSLMLPGGAVFCFTHDRSKLNLIEKLSRQDRFLLPEKIVIQEAAAAALLILSIKNNSILAEGIDPAAAARNLLRSPEEFLRSLYGKNCEAPFVLWEWPADVKRCTMIPPGYFLLMKSSHRIRVLLTVGGKFLAFSHCLQDDSGSYFVLIPPQAVPEQHKRAWLRVGIFSGDKLNRFDVPLLYLAPDVSHLQAHVERPEFQRSSFRYMHGNGRGALIWYPVEPGALYSRYDAVLLANLNPEYPENRHIMLRRFRIWSHYHAKTQAFCQDCLKRFQIDNEGAGVWLFEIPVGNGLFVEISMKLEIIPGRNVVLLTLQRHGCGGRNRRLCDDSPVRLIVRPDIEDRDFHHGTKASEGPERLWPNMIQPAPKGFDFRPAANRILSVASNRGNFIRANEWQYMIWQENEAARGLDPNSDLYSPGYFEISLGGNETVTLAGQIVTAPDEPRYALPNPEAPKTFSDLSCEPVEAVLKRSLAQFIVKRENFKTVIAGYPWFLDWGRDTLIVARGLVSVPSFLEDAKKILLQFASFAEKGTIPNMISGGNAENRDTSDAPLWLFIACRDLCHAEKSREFLKTSLPKGKTLLETLTALAEDILAGTPNGICADPESMLVFSPPHFTWMDTNYPAATPRQGYPVEIQALWFAALRFLSEALPKEGAAVWRERADRTARSIQKYFLLQEKNYLSDCLHCDPGVSPGKAVPSDHLRPNQLYAVTLGAIPPHSPIAAGILDACGTLLIPGAIRSLADRPVHYPLPVVDAGGRLLNDPVHPYWGSYEGNEDLRRKPAYHNGTAWTWQFPAYCEAFYMIYGGTGKAAARSLLSSMSIPMNAGCLCQVPEILDGDYPHRQRGCGAQAWSVSEMLRVWKLLH